MTRFLSIHALSNRSCGTASRAPGGTRFFAATQGVLLAVAGTVSLISLAPLSLVSLAHAEDRMVSTLRFPVEEFSAVGEDLVKIRIDGQSRFVARDDADDYVVEKYLADHPDKFSRDELLLFVDSSLKEAHTERAASGLLALLKQIPVDQLADRIEELSKDPNGSEAVKQALLRAKDAALPPSARALLTMQVALDDSEWFRTKAVSQAFTLGGAFVDEVERRFRYALLRKDYDLAGKVVDLEGAVLGESDPHYQTLLVTMSRIRLVLEDLKSGDLDRLVLLSKMQAQDKGLSMLGPVILETIHREADKALTNGRLGSALQLLSSIDFERRTETTHALTLRAVKLLVPARQTPVDHPDVERFLSMLSRKDPEVMENYVAFLDAQAHYLIEEELVAQSEYILSKLVALRPDPNAGNDRIRAAQAARYLQLGVSDLASRRLSEIQTGLTLGDRVRLLRSQSIRWSWIFLVPLIIAAITVVLRVIRPHLGDLRRTALRAGGGFRPAYGADEDDEPESEEDRPKGFSLPSQNRAPSPVMQEYHELLKVFGLSAAATLSEIKRAYRNSVKEYHPDLQHGAQDAKASERFIQLTASYERLLEIRSALNLP